MNLFLPEISISGEEIFKVFGFSVTNTFLFGFIVAAAIFIFASLSLRPKRIIPKGLQNLWEFIFESLYNFTNSITNDINKTKEIFPLACTLFVLILFSNLLELVPGVGVFHFLRSPSSDLNFTFALSLTSIIYVNFLALRRLGFFSYIKKFINKNPILLFVGVLEGLSEMTRIISLAVRLFGNLFAGEVLLIVTSALFAFLLPLPFLGLEILVGFIQAFIFSSLIIIFYATATQHGEEHAK